MVDVNDRWVPLAELWVEDDIPPEEVEALAEMARRYPWLDQGLREPAFQLMPTYGVGQAAAEFSCLFCGYTGPGQQKMRELLCAHCRCTVAWPAEPRAEFYAVQTDDGEFHVTGRKS